MQKLKFNRWGWIVICIEENANYTKTLLFNDAKNAEAFLKANANAYAVQ